MAQIIIYMDGDLIRAEAPGPNGSRTKIDLGPDFRERNPELVSALLDQQWRGRILDREREAELKAQRERDKEKKKAYERQVEAAKAQGRSYRVYDYIADRHHIELANRCIPASRRPRGTYKDANGNTFKPRKMDVDFDPNFVVDIDLLAP